MSSSSEQERLQDEIGQLRGDLGETVEALVHKVDVPARTKERVDELKEQAVERADELKQQAVERAGGLKQQAVERADELKQQAVERGSAAKDRAVDLMAQARERAGRTPAERWAMLAGAGAALITAFAIVRRLRAR